MDKLFKYYALDGRGIQGANKRPIDHAYDSAEAAFKISTFCLETAVPAPIDCWPSIPPTSTSTTISTSSAPTVAAHWKKSYPQKTSTCCLCTHAPAATAK